MDRPNTPREAICSSGLLENTVGCWTEQAVSGDCSGGKSCKDGAKIQERQWNQLSDMCDRTASQLTALLHGRRITTYIQPIVEANGSSIWGYECLMRGIQHDGAIIPLPPNCCSGPKPKT